MSWQSNTKSFVGLGTKLVAECQQRDQARFCKNPEYYMLLTIILIMGLFVCLLVLHVELIIKSGSNVSYTIGGHDYKNESFRLNKKCCTSFAMFQFYL